jgi:hypothetical protein
LRGEILVRKNKKLLALVMVFAFALSGIAYAAWTDTLYINGTVATGTLDAQWACADPPSDNDGTEYINVGPWWLPIYVENPNDVGDVDSDRTFLTASMNQDNDNGLNDLLTITIHNAYPGYQASIPWVIKNTGSIPIKLDAPTGAPNDAAYTVTGLPTASGRINAGDCVSGTINVVVNDGAAEDTDYTFQVVIPVKQFNK